MSSTRAHALSLVSLLLFALALTGCQETIEERDITTTTGDPGLPSVGSPGNRDTGTDADDVGDVGDADSDANLACTLTPRPGTDPTIEPCCFTDQDCQDSGALNAQRMRCYASLCTSGGEGICLIPPAFDQDCWDDSDCPSEQRCVNAFIGTCSQPATDIVGACQDR